MDPRSDHFPYANTSFKMVQELARNPRIVGNPFDEAGKQAVVLEMNQLFDSIQTKMINQSDMKEPSVATTLQVQHLSILRNKQCLLAYLMARIRMVQMLRWELSSEILPQEVTSCLSPEEKRFQDEYNAMLRKYMNTYDLDLTLNWHEPPVELNIQVLVLQDYGTIVTEEGSITLKKNTTVVMSRAVAEPFIKMGILQHITYPD